MKKKFILKFLTGTAFNVIMGVILASMVGISPAYGAASGIVVPMLLKGFMPAGAAMEGVYTEVWTGELVRQLGAGLTASFLDGIPDYSARVNNEIIHLWTWRRSGRAGEQHHLSHTHTESGGE